MEEEKSDVIDVKKLLKSVVKHGASDLHLVSRSEPQIRIGGKLKSVNLPVLVGDDIEEMCYSVITEKQKQFFEEHNELDFAIQLPGIGRFRGNYYKTMGDMAAAFRIIPTEIPSLDQLNAPPVYKEIIKREKGVILVTGPTGSGKSTTMAAIINEINLTESKHILTVEDPVEFIHQNKKSLFSHRGVGDDTNSFAAALKYALRQDPDVIVIGEMRTRETIEAGLSAAETGHLVFGTLHTSSAPGTISRILDVFGGDEQPAVRAMIAGSLIAVISQMLLPKLGGGRVAAPEILVTTNAIANLIREDKVHQIYSQMQLGQGNSGMQTQTQVLMREYEAGKVSKDVILQYANKKEEVKKKLGMPV